MSGGVGDVSEQTLADPRPGSGISMDPRIRARRIAVTRDEGRRRLRILLAAVAVCGSLALAVGLLHTPLLSATTVRIDGNHQTTRQAILRASGLDRRPLMIDVDGPRLRAVIERLPWVAAATVSRHWPSTVHVSVTERSAVAVVGASGGGVDAVDETGRILASGAQTFPGLPLVSGVAGGGPPGATLDPSARPGLLVAKALGDLAGRVAQVAVGPGATVELHLAGQGPVVALGPVEEADDLAAKLEAVRTLLNRVDLKGVTTIDVRVPRAPVLTRR